MAVVLRHAVNGGLAEVPEHEAEVLIASSQWVVADEPVKKAARVHAKASSKLER